MYNKVYLYGKNPLKEAISAQKRGKEGLIKEVFITKNSQNEPEIMSLLQASNLSYKVVTKEEIESMVGRESVNQGICALLDEKFLYDDLNNVLEKIKDKNSLLILLDELEDPHNVGAIIRSAKAFGAEGVIIGERNQVNINATVIKSATGMNFSIPIIKVGNINDTLRTLKEKRFWIYGLTKDGDTNLESVKFDEPTVIVVGSEGKGIREKTLDLCDFKLSIKIDKGCESLNASNASAVASYEWHKQNKS